MSSPSTLARPVALQLINSVLRRHKMLDDAVAACKEFSVLSSRDRAFVWLLISTCLRRLGQIDDLLDYFDRRQGGASLGGPAGSRIARTLDDAALKLGPLPTMIADRARLRVIGIGRRARKLPALVQGGRHLVTEARIVGAGEEAVEFHERKILKTGGGAAGRMPP